jgi:hypothetical protein
VRCNASQANGDRVIQLVKGDLNERCTHRNGWNVVEEGFSSNRMMNELLLKGNNFDYRWRLKHHVDAPQTWLQVNCLDRNVAEGIRTGDAVARVWEAISGFGKVILHSLAGNGDGDWLRCSRLLRTWVEHDLHGWLRDVTTVELWFERVVRVVYQHQSRIHWEVACALAVWAGDANVVVLNYVEGVVDHFIVVEI